MPLSIIFEDGNPRMEFWPEHIKFLFWWVSAYVVKAVH